MTLAAASGTATPEGSAATNQPEVLVVVGAPGEPEYAPQFHAWANQWRAAAETGGASFRSIGLDTPGSIPDRAVLEQCLATWAGKYNAPAWLVLVGHGTYNNSEAKFNLRGPDISAAELVAWLEPCHRPLVLIQCASASGPFLAALSHTNRVVITATRSGDEQNFTRFGEFIAQNIASAAADLDKDGQTSLLEAFLAAARHVSDFYASSGRLATEHALLDDNGDRLGTPPDWFEGVRATKRAADGALPDGLRAHQVHLVPTQDERALPAPFRASRDQIESELEQLRARKADLEPEPYLSQLEGLLLRLARLYEAAGLLPPPQPHRP